ncbi:MAG TPA: polysaccharide deacetylase family protein [Thermoanaerobacterales bacterium]|nr:polysaccharide deacetylase family protein [Thermoanaerobacterales bacterium]
MSMKKKKTIITVIFFVIAGLLLYLFVGSFIQDSLGEDRPGEIEGKVEDDLHIDENGDESGQSGPDIIDDDIKPNELGKVMIIMYHDISGKEGEWSRHYDNFREDLETFYKKGYRLISINDFLSNNIDVPRGMTPLILTFDDGTKGQFNYIEEGNGDLVIDPNCAVGIIKEFNKEYPDFGNSAVFYINYPVPFGQKKHVEKKLNYLIENGMEIGNHTYNHGNLRRLGVKELQKEIALHVKSTKEYLGDDYDVNTLALPYGESSKENMDYIIKGEHSGTDYYNKGILLVGAEPTLVPSHKNFNQYRIPRIRGSEKYINMWLEYFDKNPSQRYISDGNPNTITIPKSAEKNFTSQEIDEKGLVVY